ncbi:MAG: hypothetical protein HQK53_08570 [Oligoflexia bacterium]|nr:hypothetical protein [Oligoflexia bacterium]
MILKKGVIGVISFFLLCTAFTMPSCYAKSSDAVISDGVVYSAHMYHWRQEYPSVGQWGFYICANVFDTKRNPVNVKRVSVIMGNHPNYFPGWMIDSDTRMFSENAHSHCIGPWNVGQISEDSVGGEAIFDLYNGERIKIRDLRLNKPSADWSTGPIPISDILARVL